MFNFFKKRSMPITETLDAMMNQQVDPQIEPSVDLTEDLTVTDFMLNDPAALGWTSVQEQQLLFSIMTFFCKENESILDVGCGRADLVKFADQYLNLPISLYKGIDINSNMINVARKKYTGVDVEVADIISYDTDKKYHWVMASGVFNLLEQDDMSDYLAKAVDKMYNICSVGVAFNLLTEMPSYLTEQEKQQMAVYTPGTWFEYFINRYKRVICRSDYMTGDATFFILK